MALQTSDTDERNPAYNPGDIHAQEISDPYARAGIDQAEAFANDPHNASENIDDVKKQENDAPWRQERRDKLNSWKDQVTGQDKFGGKKAEHGRQWSKDNVSAVLKKKGPMGLLITLLIVGTVGLGSASLPALLLIHIKEAFTKSLDASDPALTRATTRLMASKIGNINNTFSETSDGKCGVKCRMSTMDDAMKRNFEAKSFTVEGEKKFGRWTVHSITFPVDATNPKAPQKVIKTGNDWKVAMRDPLMASAVNKVFNSKTEYFMNSKFGQTLRTRGLDKLSKLTGDTKAKVIESLRKSLGLEGANAATDPAAKITDPEEKLAKGPLKDVVTTAKASGGKLAGEGANVVGASCLVYETSKGISLATKVGKLKMFLPLAMMTLNLSDKIMAANPKDNATGEEVSQVADMWTQQDANKTTTDGKPNPYYGKSATDSAAFQMSTTLDNPSLGPDDQTYGAGLATSGVLGLLASLTAFVVKGGPTAIGVARNTCKTANNVVVNIAVQCPEELMAAIATGIETAGVGAAVSAVTCAVKAGVIMFTMSQVLSGILGKLIPLIVSTQLPNISENMRGASVSTATRTGAASILGDGKSMSNGLKPATSSDEVKSYALAMASQQRDDVALARYDAKSTPFDIYNQYSFLGSIVGNLQLDQYSNSSLATMFRGIASIVPNSFASLASGNYALADATNATKKANLYTPGNCSDPALQSVGVVTDSLCNTTQVISEAEINADYLAVTDTLTQTSQVDANTGNAIPGSDYEKYLTNCANRNPYEPLGETSASIEDDDYEWKVGLNCGQNSTQMSDFHTYTLYNNVENTTGKTETLDNTIKSSSSSTTTPTPGTISGNGSAIKGDDYPWPNAPIGANNPATNFSYRECVDFAAWRLNEQAGATASGPFTTYAAYGSALTWKDRAVADGKVADHTPTLGSVAWWGPNVSAGGALNAGPSGHVAIVSAVNPNNGTITIEQYNGTAPGHTYSKMDLTSAQYASLMFLHIHDIGASTT